LVVKKNVLNSYVSLFLLSLFLSLTFPSFVSSSTAAGRKELFSGPRIDFLSLLSCFHLYFKPTFLLLFFQQQQARSFHLPFNFFLLLFFELVEIEIKSVA
jgi:hypothetical protein